MNTLKVDPATLTSVAATHAGVASDIAAAATRVGVDGAALTAVLGAIGTEFVSAAQAATRRLHDQVLSVADGSRRLDHDLRAAGAAYSCTDHEAASEISSTVGAAHGGRVA